MSSTKIAPAGETMPQQDAEADDFWEGDSGCYTVSVPNMFILNPLIGIAKADELNGWFYAMHMPIFEMGAYESLWMSPDASFRSIAKAIGGKYENLPSHFVDSAIAHEVSQEVAEHFGGDFVMGMGIMARRDPLYPIRMLDAKHRVQMFYWAGDIGHLYTRCVSVTGTRNASREGKRRTVRLTRKLVENGFTIVSGLSRGIDTIAAQAALNCGGKVIAVIGTPLTECIPKENRMLQEKISKGHLLISQVPMMRYSMQTKKENQMFFRERDATVSALSEASLIVEAGNRSDALRQARAAFYQKRKVLIHDSCFKDSRLTWPAEFEKRGAIRIRSSRDLAEELATPPPHISMDASIPLGHEDETDSDYAERIGAYADSGAIPGYAPAAPEDQQQSGGGVGKYWRFMNEANRCLNGIEWYKSRRKGGEILDIPESLPPE